jgi:hypothetical protein
VLSSTEMPQASTIELQEEDRVGEGLMEEMADFDEFVIWGHVELPDEATDPYLRAIEEYTAFADVVCSIIHGCYMI